MAILRCINVWTFDMCWRFICIQLGYLIFAIGSLILVCIVMPIIRVLSRPEARQRRIRFLISRTFAVFIGFLRVTGVLKHSIQGLDKIQPGNLVLANHPSLLDIVFLISFIPNADCVVKTQLLRNPVTRFPILSAGYIVNDDPEEVIEQARRSFAAGSVLIIFPEGTRSREGESIVLKRGASQVAVRAVRDITPVLIRSHNSALTKQCSWFSVTESPWNFNFEVRDQLPIQNWLADGMPCTVQARHVTDKLQSYFNDQLSPQ